MNESRRKTVLETDLYSNPSCRVCVSYRACVFYPVIHPGSRPNDETEAEDVNWTRSQSRVDGKDLFTYRGKLVRVWKGGAGWVWIVEDRLLKEGRVR